MNSKLKFKVKDRWSVLFVYLAAGSSYKKFNALLTKFAKVDENDSWKHYNLMMTHFPHYAKLNQVNSQSQSPRSFGGSQEQQFEFFTSGLNEKKETLDVIPETDQEDDADSVIMPLQQNYWNDVIFKWQNDPDQIFIAELFKNMQGLNEEMKSLFKIKVQSLMHNLKYNCRSMNYPE